MTVVDKLLENMQSILIKFDSFERRVYFTPSQLHLPSQRSVQFQRGHVSGQPRVKGQTKPNPDPGRFDAGCSVKLLAKVTL